VKPADVEQSLRDIYKKVTNKGPGGHILTGPIFVEGAEPGDVLEVESKQIKWRFLTLTTRSVPARVSAGGFSLREDAHHSLDEKRMSRLC